jgi:hypothetical protein
MEAITMGFALLLVRGHHTHIATILGAVLAIALLLSVGLLRSKAGWIVGSTLQLMVIVYGRVIPAMYFMGVLFAILWACAYYFGKKAESIRATLTSQA